MKKTVLVISLATIIFTNSAFAKKMTIGKVSSGGKSYVVYTNGKGIYLRKGITDFALVCDTGFIRKGDYFLSPSGQSYNDQNTLIRAIQTRLVYGKIKNCG